MEVLDPKKNLNTELKLPGKVQWDVGSKSNFLRRIVRIAQKEMFLNFALFRNALLSEDELKECVKAFVADVNIEETLIPFGAITADLISGKQLIFGPIFLTTKNLSAEEKKQPNPKSKQSTRC